MKHGRTVPELAVEIDRQFKAKKDFLINTNQIQAHVIGSKDAGGTDFQLGFALKGADYFTGALTNNGHNQLGSYLNIPAKYYDMMRLDSSELLAYNVKHWLERQSDRRTIRTMDGNIRAILSDKYRRLDNYDLANHVLPMLQEAQASIESCEITENKLYIKAITHKVQAEVKVGDVVSAGVLISNSETGHGSLSVKPLVYRLVCRNGAVADKYAMKKYHVGRVSEMEQIEFSNDTLNAEDKAFWLKCRDLVKHSLNDVTFKKIVAEMHEATTLKIEKPEHAIELATKRFDFGVGEQSDILKHLIEGGDLTSWGLGNAVTRMAQDVESYDRSTELESIGFEIMGQSWN